MFSKLKEFQSDVYRLLENSYKKNRLVHTYLFSGQPGTLKDEASKYLASLLLCENKNACGKCQECKKILEGQSNNVFTIIPEGQNIKKSQIQELEHEFSLTSPGIRIFIIKDIDQATSASANALLKFLEETNPNCYGVLITENLQNVIPTIKSRSQVVYFRPINREFVYQYLIENNVHRDVAKAISILTSNIDDAKILASDDQIPKIFELSKKIINSFEIDNGSVLIMGTEGKFLFRESKEYHQHFLDLLIVMQNDKIKFLLNSDNVIFNDIYKKINLNQKTQIKILEIMMEFKKKIRYNLNMELAYLQMLIEITRCKNG